MIIFIHEEIFDGKNLFEIENMALETKSQEQVSRSYLNKYTMNTSGWTIIDLTYRKVVTIYHTKWRPGFTYKVPDSFLKE